VLLPAAPAPAPECPGPAVLTWQACGTLPSCQHQGHAAACAGGPVLLPAAPTGGPGPPLPELRGPARHSNRTHGVGV
jgi:hypothetical protein